MVQNTPDRSRDADREMAVDILKALEKRIGRKGVLQAINDAIEIQELMEIAEEVNRELDAEKKNSS